MRYPKGKKNQEQEGASTLDATITDIQAHSKANGKSYESSKQVSGAACNRSTEHAPAAITSAVFGLCKLGFFRSSAQPSSNRYGCLSSLRLMHQALLERTQVPAGKCSGAGLFHQEIFQLGGNAQVNSWSNIHMRNS